MPVHAGAFMDKLSYLLDEYELDKSELNETLDRTQRSAKIDHIFDDIPIESTGTLKFSKRLKESFPSIPPGAFEKLSVKLHLPQPLEMSQSIVMVRLHTSNRFYDFPCNLKIVLDPQAI